MSSAARGSKAWMRAGLILLLAAGLGLGCDALRDDRVFFRRAAPAVRPVAPAPGP
jgi:hypothetical protein